jgi:hypothetical protein
VRLFVVVRGVSEIIEAHRARDYKAVEALLNRRLRLTGPVRLRVDALPRSGPDPCTEAVDPEGEEVVIGLEPMTQAEADALWDHQRSNGGDFGNIEIAGDLPLATAEAWCPGGATFGRADRALSVIGAGLLAAKQATGCGVKVIVVDQGIAAGRLPEGRFPEQPPEFTVNPGAKPKFGEPGAKPRVPGEAPFGHGTRMAQLILSVAPDALIYDLPLLPPRVHNRPAFLSLAKDVFKAVEDFLKDTSANPGPWVVCNAWSIYDLTGDPSSTTTKPYNYGQNPDHPFTRHVRHLVTKAGADVVFAAGNCGEYCPDGRCATAQVGPGRSIYGVAALKEVLTTGAVRSDGAWLGHASQGPSPAAFASSKPDLCAPSQFGSLADAGISYTGTSSACALAAGAVAALRDSRFAWGGGGPPSPAELIGRLRDAAALPEGVAKEDHSYGDGVLDLGAFLARCATVAEGTGERSGTATAA